LLKLNGLPAVAPSDSGNRPGANVTIANVYRTTPPFSIAAGLLPHQISKQFKLPSRKEKNKLIKKMMKIRFLPKSRGGCIVGWVDFFIYLFTFSIKLGGEVLYPLHKSGKQQHKFFTSIDLVRLIFSVIH
jgi:hypothetical protein